MKTTPGIIMVIAFAWCIAGPASLQAQKPTTRATSGDQTCIDQAKVRPDAQCERVYEPVCGCNGKTYQNECDAARAGVKTFTKGECAGSAHEAVKKYIVDWEVAYNEGDAKKLEALFAVDGIQIRPDGEVHEGSATISARYAQSFTAIKRKIAIQILDVVPVCEGKVWFSGIYTTKMQGLDAGVKDQYSGAYVGLLEQVNGRWVMVRHFISDSDNAKAPVSRAAAGQ